MSRQALIYLEKNENGMMNFVTNNDWTLQKKGYMEIAIFDY